MTYCLFASRPELYKLCNVGQHASKFRLRILSILVVIMYRGVENSKLEASNQHG